MKKEQRQKENIPQDAIDRNQQNRFPETSEPTQRKYPTAGPKREPEKKEKTNLFSLPTFSERGYLQAVIEIPAGSNVKYEYKPDPGEFIANGTEKEARMVEFLPYPTNYGFIPSTLMSREAGGDDDPLDVIVLSKRVKQGEIIEVVPLAMLRCTDEGERDDKILAIPLDKSRQLFRANRMKDIPEAVLQILEIWFMNYKRNNKIKTFGWADEKEAEKTIRKWKISYDLS